MGAPKRNRRKYEKPKEMWSTERIKADNALRDEYGLKSMKELWLAQTRVSRVRRNAREFLSGAASGSTTKDEQAMIGRLTKYGITKSGATLDDLLDLNEMSFLERRLQSVVMRKGLAKSMKQARQIIVHGFIAINGKRANRPGYLVSLDEEKGIGYYKPIQIMQATAQAGVAPQEEPAVQAPEAAQAGAETAA